MKTRILWTIPLAATLATCDSVTGPDQPLIDPPSQGALLTSPPNVAGQEGAPVLKVEQVSSGEGQVVGWCDEAAGVARFSVPGTGTMTHLGRFTVRQTHCTNVATGAVTGGVATAIAANGDEIHLIYTGMVVPGIEPLTADLLYVATGGTGRFVDVTGEMEVRVVHPTPTTWTSRGSGWISYSASDRSGR